jgi:hypothetical protein
MRVSCGLRVTLLSCCLPMGVFTGPFRNNGGLCWPSADTLYCSLLKDTRLE